MPTPTTSAVPAGDLATQVARLFFERQMTKMEIAGHLGISRFRVARLIDGALADGAVRIEIRDVPAEDRGLATALEERFGLDLCAVASGAGASAPRLAGALLGSLITDDEVIGIAWGSTLAEVVREVPTRAASGIEVIQLAGSSMRLERTRDAGELARILADRLGATCHAIYAPAFVGSVELRSELVRHPEVAGAMDRFDRITLAIVGIGAMPPADAGSAVDGASSSLLRSGVLDESDVRALQTAGAVGDLVVHPFDRAGRFLAPELTARAVAIDRDALGRIPRVLAVAAGAAKADAIRGALATGIVRILVTDARTARAVLDGA